MFVSHNKRFLSEDFVGIFRGLLLGLSSVLLSASRGLDCDVGMIPACLHDNREELERIDGNQFYLLSRCTRAFRGPTFGLNFWPFGALTVLQQHSTQADIYTPLRHA